MKSKSGKAVKESDFKIEFLSSNPDCPWLVKHKTGFKICFNSEESALYWIGNHIKYGENGWK